jgi:hypothetical protein
MLLANNYNMCSAHHHPGIETATDTEYICPERPLVTAGAAAARYTAAPTLAYEDEALDDERDDGSTLSTRQAPASRLQRVQFCGISRSLGACLHRVAAGAVHSFHLGQSPSCGCHMLAAHQSHQHQAQEGPPAQRHA